MKDVLYWSVCGGKRGVREQSGEGKFGRRDRGD